MMKTAKKLVVLVLAICLLFTFVACGQQENDRPKFLAVGTAAATGAYYPIGISVADILNNELKINTTAQVTGGALENISLVNDKSIDLAITQGNAALDAVKGQNNFSSANENISALFGGLSRGYFQVIVLEDSSIQTMSDLVGKRVVMGPAGNGAIAVAETIWAEYGFGVADIRPSYISYSDGISSLTDGNTDAVVIQTAIPTAAVQELTASGKAFRLIEVDETVGTKLCDKFGYFGHGTIASSVYGLSKDYSTMFITNMFIIRKDFSEELVYEMTKAIFENLDTLKASHASVKKLTLEGAVRTSIPLHPGAEKYFKEIGAIA